VRERASAACEFDPAKIRRGRHGKTDPPDCPAMLPLVVVVSVNLLMSMVVLSRLDLSFLVQEQSGRTSASALGGAGRLPRYWRLPCRRSSLSTDRTTRPSATAV
jgi:hypothetical protein